jgi:hypothetical protein
VGQWWLEPVPPAIRTSKPTSWAVQPGLLGTSGHSNIAHQLNNVFAPTDLSVTYHVNPRYTGERRDRHHLSEGQSPSRELTL